LHDIGHQDGIDYLVMEYLEGETLAQRLSKGALPLDQMLRYAIEIADALDQAQRHGITHRDLKPGNIMLTRSGAKLLDFGLAKHKVEAASSRLGPSAETALLLPTGNGALTEKGTLLGTLQYMAPAQLEGKDADARTDIFAFGAVLYEMATGRKAFEGKSQASLIAAILEHDSRFTFNPDGDWSPIWSPDGRRIVFASVREGTFNLVQKSAGGAGSEEVLLSSGELKVPYDWFPDGPLLVYRNVDPKTWLDIWVLPLFGQRKLIPYAQTEFRENQARLSPDGRWITYTSDESGRPQVYVQGFPAPAGKWPISTEGGEDAQWRGDGKELFYLSFDRKLTAVGLKLGPTFQAGVPRALFQTRVTGSSRDHYAVTRDGQRFLVNTLVKEAGSEPLTVVLNWTAELRR
jgi:serine/threonine protein kinase